jgi:NAD(P)-dependent dehydrogenase (short-subunit alcohol dehydrogenase family)
VTGGPPASAAIARRLAAAGATVGVADLDVEGARGVAESMGNASFPLQMDIARADQ